jgi:hypothetical protein
MTRYHIATTPYASSFVIVEEHQPSATLRARLDLTDIPDGYFLSGWPPFDCESDDVDIIMQAAQAHIGECEYLKLWHIYMN